MKSRSDEPRMIYMKATAVGIVAALMFSAGWMWATRQIPIWWQMWQERNQGGGIGASSVGSGSVLLPALIGFIVGFFWIMRRARSRPAAR